MRILDRNKCKKHNLVLLGGAACRRCANDKKADQLERQLEFNQRIIDEAESSIRLATRARAFAQDQLARLRFDAPMQTTPLAECVRCGARRAINENVECQACVIVRGLFEALQRALDYVEGEEEGTINRKVVEELRLSASAFARLQMLHREVIEALQ